MLALERRFQATFEQAAVGIAHVAPDGSWLRVNQKVCDIIGYSRDELLTKTFQDITHPDDLNADVAYVGRMLAGDIENYAMEKRYIRKDGSFVWINLTVGLVSKPDGTPDFFVSIIEDIDRRKEAETALRESEARWKRLVDHLPDVIYQYSSKRGGLYCSRQVERVFGVSPDYLLAHPTHWPESIHPDDQSLVQRALDNLRTGTAFAIEYRIKDDHGNWHWLYDRSIAHRMTDGELLIEGLATDITESKRQAQALIEAQTQFQEITNSVPGAIFQYVLHVDGSDALANMTLGCREIWEISAEELINDPSPLWDAVLADDITGLAKSIEQSAKTLGFWKHEWRIRTPSGILKWLSGTGMPTRLENGDIQWNSVVIDVTQQRHIQNAFDSFFDQQMSLNMIVDLKGTILQVNPLWEQTLGYTRDELIGTHFIDYVHPDDRQRTRDETGNIAEQGCGSGRFENRYRHKDGGYRLISWSSRISFDEGLIYAIATDITESRQAEEKLLQAATVFNSTAEGVMVTDLNGIIQDVNGAFLSITGYDKHEVIGKNPRILQSGRHDHLFYQTMWRTLRETGHWRGEIWNRRKDGDAYPVLMSISTIWDDQKQPRGYVGIFTDITAIKEHQDRLDYLAHHDPLTGLPNRLLFDSRLSQSIRHATRAGSTLAVVFVDLDRFKHINDSMGHAAGDALLIQIAERLLHAIRAVDTLARISGDEFVILLEDIGGPENAAHVVGSLLDSFAPSFQVDNREITMKASMGISLFPQDASDPSTLLANADAAMYKAKEAGRNTYLFYSEEFTTQAFEYIFLENALRHALTHEQFYLVYQPQVRLDNEDVVGMEVLLRWLHPDQGIISPLRFIPIAEHCGLIRDIGRWVLMSACQQGRSWLDAGLPVGRMSVNVAGPQFQHEHFVDEVTQILERTGFPPQHLTLEITETFVMGHADKSIHKLKQVRQLDIEVAIDDFGTGYSSLSYLKKLPIDKLKIDQSFVRDIPRDSDDVAIAEAIIALGKALNLQVIAEGIETLEQVEFFKSHIGMEGQGYHFARPMEAAKMQQYLTRKLRLPRIRD
ncbi:MULTISPECIES: PAS domain S-box protein [unclassified Thiocapsa]|uniref:PAS domain S-box protein n=1 Tax=unclassified Thiocapsa TaxID=2641286 RepID=UPI0035B2F72F